MMTFNQSLSDQDFRHFNNPTTPDPYLKTHRAIGFWLLISAFMVFAMMLIGAITRLTESGLSMVEWRPLIGSIPPFSQEEWIRIFTLYQQTSEYQIENAGMTLAEFKKIFWWEYIHRLWGRLIGIVYALPLLYFFIKGWIPVSSKKHLLILLLLGGLQGIIGWWMVKSGFVDRSDVSVYRLTLHLGFAFLILGYLLWMAHSFLITPMLAPKCPPLFQNWSILLFAIICITTLSGAVVAGSNAGFVYNDWPFMGGEIIPQDFWTTTPVWRSAFEEPGTVQLNHRMMAYLTLALVTLTWVISRTLVLTTRERFLLTMLVMTVWCQASIGVATLLFAVPLEIAVPHQAGAIILFSLSLWFMKEVRYKNFI